MKEIGGITVWEEEREQIERLYRKYRNELIVHIYRFTGDWDSANEGVQEVFRVACEKRDILFSTKNQIAWLNQIAKNIALNTLKKQQQRETHFLSLEDIPENYRPFIIGGELIAIEDDILNKRFSKENQELLQQIYIEGLPYPFIRYIPIVIVMSISRISGCATICRKEDNRVPPYLLCLMCFFRQRARNSQLSARGSSQRGDDKQWGQ